MNEHCIDSFIISNPAFPKRHLVRGLSFKMMFEKYGKALSFFTVGVTVGKVKKSVQIVCKLITEIAGYGIVTVTNGYK